MSPGIAISPRGVLGVKGDFRGDDGEATRRNAGRLSSPSLPLPLLPLPSRDALAPPLAREGGGGVRKASSSAGVAAPRLLSRLVLTLAMGSADVARERGASMRGCAPAPSRSIGGVHALPSR